jgi:dimethylargininase
MKDVDEEATLDGGDCMLVGDHLYVGLSARTNGRGAAVFEKVSQHTVGTSGGLVVLRSSPHF